MLSLEERLSYMANAWNNELALLESCITSLGFDRSLAVKLLQKATHESIRTGRPTLDILREYRDKLRMGYTCDTRWSQYGGDL